MKPAEFFCNIKVKSSHKVLIVFHDINNYDSHLIIQEMEKFYLKVNLILNGLERYRILNINIKFFIRYFRGHR